MDALHALSIQTRKISFVQIRRGLWDHYELLETAANGGMGISSCDGDGVFGAKAGRPDPIGI